MPTFEDSYFNFNLLLTYFLYFLFCYEPVDYVTKYKMNRHTIYAVIDSDFNLVVWRLWLQLPNLMYTNTAHNHVYYKAMHTEHYPLCQTKCLPVSIIKNFMFRNNILTGMDAGSGIIQLKLYM